jgi:hypothetical protein
VKGKKAGNINLHERFCLDENHQANGPSHILSNDVNRTEYRCLRIYPFISLATANMWDGKGVVT